MNKLLLLATSLISLTIQSRGATYPSPEERLRVNETIARNDFNDSTGKQIILANPKEGFRNLFVDDAYATMSIGKLNPRAISFVQDYVLDNEDRLDRMKDWGRPYFDLINNVLTSHGLPVELKYLAVIESDLKSTAVSWAGAVGPWQLMPATARQLGLTVTGKRDDRRDYQKSTHAAAKYLTYLYGLYKDWLLVIAAYNGGPGNVNAAIRKSGSRNFWDLQNYLPTESRNHVKKFIATHFIMEGTGGMTTLTRGETDLLSMPGRATVDSTLSVSVVSGKYTAQIIASAIGLTITEFNRFNPGFDKSLSAKGSYELRLPAEKMDLFHTKKGEILEQSMQALIGMNSRTGR
jgi:membrane-bound lytic murein transglycosylase D